MPNDLRKSPSGKLVSVSGGIPDGSYVGQPVFWDGVEYLPVPLDSALVLRAIESDAQFGLTSVGGMNLNAGSFIGITAASGAVAIEATTSSITVTAGQDYTLNVASGASFMAMSLNATALESPGIQIRCTGGDDFLTLASGSIQMSTVGQLLFDSATLGFFSQAAVARPSITGATTQEQVDSVIAALAALGLVTDDR